MKNRNGKFIGALLFTLLITGTLLLYQNNAKTETSLRINAIAYDMPQVGDKIRLDFQIISDASDFTIIALPDTQHYSEIYPEIFLSQTQWVVENKDALNIVFVTHLGDIVQNNDMIPAEWVAADAALNLLDGEVPYGVLPGNHDMQEGGQAKYYQEYFPASRYENQDWWGGSFDQNKNNYQLFSAGGDDYLTLHLQFCPPFEAIDWANEIVQQYPERKVIVSTHGFLYSDASRMTKCKEHSTGAYPEQIWGKLIKNNTNIFFVLSGHIPGVARRADNQGRVVYQILADYQDMEKGGNGYLRIMTFQPNNDMLQVSTYSPYLNEYLTDDGNQFKLPFEMTSGKMPTGTVTVSNGIDECTGSVEEGSCELVLTILNEFTASYSGDENYKGSTSSDGVSQ